MNRWRPMVRCSCLSPAKPPRCQIRRLVGHKVICEQTGLEYLPHVAKIADFVRNIVDPAIVIMRV